MPTRLPAAGAPSSVDAGESGHINADSGHGPWPEGTMVFAQFLGRLSPDRGKGAIPLVEQVLSKSFLME
ncbi:alpha/beta hydrolase [Rhizobium beringeri]